MTIDDSRFLPLEEFTLRVTIRIYTSEHERRESKTDDNSETALR